MSEVKWAAVDRYLEDRHVGDDVALAEALQGSDAAGLPKIAVSPSQGKLLQLLAASVGAQRILEVGTLGGYSAIWMARALPVGGTLISLEADPLHAEVARGNLARAGLADKVDIWIGTALDLLPKVAAADIGPIDFSFIDADKANIPDYFDWAVKLSRPGALIVVDNVIRNGAIIDPNADSPDVVGVRRFLDGLKDDRRVAATTIQTVGVKGHDGFTLAMVTGD
jgi:predicted O-methyltransferase YrrM